MANKLNTTEMNHLLGALQGAALGDARWDELAHDLVLRTPGERQLIGEKIRAGLKLDAALGGEEAPGPDDLADGKPQNYLGEALACGNAVYCGRDVVVGPVRDFIGRKVHPAGALHSSSGAPASVPGGTILVTQLEPSAAAALPLDDGTLRRPLDPRRFVRVPAGMTLDVLNRLLDAEDLALENLPAYMGLTVGGAISTAAHGSGATLGPFCDLVASITLVQADGRRLRVEPGTGPLTDPAKWEKAFPAALPCAVDDDTFYAVVVGVGCMGVIEEVVLRVVDAFLLSEVRTPSTWSAVQELLRAKRYADSRHMEILVSPYKLRGEESPICTVLTRQLTAQVDRPLAPGRNPSELASEVFPHFGDLLAKAVERAPGLGPVLARTVVALYGLDAGANHGLVGQRCGGKSFVVLDIGATNQVKGVATEIAFTIRDGDVAELIARVDDILDRAAKQQQAAGWVHTLPISLRFARASQHFLAMQHGAATDVVCMVEMLAMHDVAGFDRALDAFQEDSRGAGRPHWGQRNNRMDNIAAGYPRIGDWQRVRRERDPDDRFGNQMTTRLGLSPAAEPGRPAAVLAVPERAAVRLDRDELPIGAGKVYDHVTTFFVRGQRADGFAAKFIGVKSDYSRFGPIELRRDDEHQGRPFALGECFEGHMRLDDLLRAWLEHSTLSPTLRQLLAAVDGVPVGGLNAWLIGQIATNYCKITELRTATSAEVAAECKYVFLEGSPIAGFIQITVQDVPGGCLVRHTLHWQPVGAAQEAAMRAFGLRLTRVVAWIEVDLAARALHATMVANIPRPTDVEACRPALPPRSTLPLDWHNVVAVKTDVRRFTVDASAARFAQEFHRVLSTVGDFGIFTIERAANTGLFQVGDRFTGTVKITPQLQDDLHALRLPPQHGGGLGAIFAPTLVSLLAGYLRAAPPTDHGRIRELRPAEAPTYVRYDYEEGTPIAGHTTFEVEDIDEDHCRVIQTLVYQEQSAAAVEVFGTVGLYIHNRVVQREIEVTAGRLQVGWRALDP